jgi:hypothetical protein
VVEVQVVDPEGKAVAGAQIVGPAVSSFSDAEGKVILSGLEPQRSHELLIVHQGRKLGAKVVISSQDEKPAVRKIELQPLGSVTGRVLDESKMPMPGALVQLMVAVPKTIGAPYSSSAASTATLTGPNGTYRIDRLIPGARHGLMIGAKGCVAVASAEFDAQPGRAFPVPDLTVPRADQSVAGVVVDPGGKPLSGVLVNVSVPARPVGGNRSAIQLDHETLQAFTGKDGRFRISGLPQGTVQLMLRPPPASFGPQPILAQLQVPAGKQDIRIIHARPQNPNTIEAVVGQAAPEFPVRTWLNGKATPGEKRFSPKDFQGKVVVLAFLDAAKPSQRLLPQLNQLHEKLAGKGLAIVRVQEAEADHNRGAERELVKRSPTPVALVAPGAVAGVYSEAFQKYGVRATPTLFLIDRQGILRFADVDPDELPRRIEALLKP